MDLASVGIIVINIFFPCPDMQGLTAMLCMDGIQVAMVDNLNRERNCQMFDMDSNDHVDMRDLAVLQTLSRGDCLAMQGRGYE
jgi:hypothetical protein